MLFPRFFRTRNLKSHFFLAPEDDGSYLRPNLDPISSLEREISFWES